MSTETSLPTSRTPDPTVRATKGVLLGAALLGVPQLLFAVAMLVGTWVELDRMTPQQHDDSLAGLGYVFGIAFAIPPVVASFLGIGSWPLRHRTVGLVLAILACCVVAIPALFYANSLLGLLSGR
ncbi:hypothetical protein [Nocardioides stalactiti]|uniref:hypothetical protein n=1 Tax=Nocardioides stalactiti TaxID=2755356 RepID=UPI00160246B6|nr:hypothetical protein [Nocardioides stalactiti]